MSTRHNALTAILVVLAGVPCSAALSLPCAAAAEASSSMPAAYGSVAQVLDGPVALAALALVVGLAPLLVGCLTRLVNRQAGQPTTRARNPPARPIRTAVGATPAGGVATLRLSTEAATEPYGARPSSMTTSGS